jgi:hypothetical protein
MEVTVAGGQARRGLPCRIPTGERRRGSIASIIREVFKATRNGRNQDTWSADDL